jgi:predicted transcriptional regulator
VTKDELKAAIVANPHLHFARSVAGSHPELAIQTIANELGVTVQEVADALDVTIIPTLTNVVSGAADLKRAH